MRHFAPLIVLITCISAWIIAAPSHAQSVTHSAGVAVDDITPCTSGLPCNGGPGIEITRTDRGEAVQLVVGSGGNATALSAVHTRLSVRALVLADSAGGRVAILTIDGTAIDATFTRDVRDAISRQTSIPASGVLINISHTHSAPALTWVYGLAHHFGDHPPITRYVEEVKARAINAVVRASRELQPVTLSFASGTTDIAAWRRTSDSSTTQGPDTAGHSLRSTSEPWTAPLDVLVVNKAGSALNPLAILFSTACHTTATWNVQRISADFAGVARQSLEALFGGATAFFIQGFGGDVAPYQAPVTPPRPCNDTRAGVDRICVEPRPSVTGEALANDAGRRLAGHVRGLIEGTRSTLSGPIKAKSSVFQLAVDPYFSMADPNHTFSSWTSYGTQGLPVEVQILQVGTRLDAPSTWTLLASSHEVVSEYDEAVRYALGNRRNLTLAGYSNSTESYLPTRRMIDYDSRAGGRYRGFLHNGRYEGCGTSISYWLGQPNWQDSDYLNGIVAAADASFASPEPKPAYDIREAFDGRSAGRWSTYVMTLIGGQRAYDGAVRVSERAKTLEIAPLRNTAGYHYNGYLLSRPINFTGRRAVVEVVQQPNPQSTAEIAFSIAANGSNNYRFVLQAGALRTDENLDSAYQGAIRTAAQWLPAGAFDAQAGRYLSIRHDTATNEIVFESGPDGRTWTQLTRMPLKMSLQAVRIELTAGTYRPEPTPGIARLDNLSVQAAP